MLSNGQFRITATANLTNAERTGTITVTAPGAPTRTVVVTQRGRGAHSLSISSWETWSAPGSTGVQVTAVGLWTAASSDPSWLTVSNPSGMGHGVFTIRADANRTPVAREGTITVTSGGVSRTVEVTQTAGSRPRYVFGWNETNDAWFLLDRAVRNTGGNTVFQQQARTMHAHVFNVSVPFVLDTEGVVYIEDRGVAVRADVFYYRIVQAAGGGMVFLGGHAAFFDANPFLHLYVKMFVTPSSGRWNTNYFGLALGIARQ